VSAGFLLGLGQPVVVLNKRGAGASVAAHAVNASSADGYTLGLDMPRLFGRKSA
jgi:tripartite-type tricarboxylate transporter receptor subunit TctC